MPKNIEQLLFQDLRSKGRPNWQWWLELPDTVGQDGQMVCCSLHVIGLLSLDATEALPNKKLQHASILCGIGSAAKKLAAAPLSN